MPRKSSNCFSFKNGFMQRLSVLPLDSAIQLDRRNIRCRKVAQYEWSLSRPVNNYFGPMKCFLTQKCKIWYELVRVLVLQRACLAIPAIARSIQMYEGVPYGTVPCWIWEGTIEGWMRKQRSIIYVSGGISNPRVRTQ